MRLNKYASISILVTVLASGCSTIRIHTGGQRDPCELPYYIYGGSTQDALFVVAGVATISEAPFAGFMMSTIGLVDFPLSLVADTIVLPVAVFRQFAECI